MNQEWVSQKNTEREQQRKDILQEIRSFCESKGFLTSEEADAIMREIIDQDAHFGACHMPVHEAFKLRQNAENDKSRLCDFSEKLLEMMHEGNRLVEKLGSVRLFDISEYLGKEYHGRM